MTDPAGTAEDQHWMALAVQLAARGLGQTAPNPAVGAVVVARDRVGALVAGRGWTQPSGRPHAETESLRRAGALARGATLYVTLEPCAHHGRTLPCAEAVIAAGVARVVYGMVDPDPRVAGRGLAQLRDAGITVDGPILGAAAQWLTLGHRRRILEGHPFLQAKLAVSAEGRLPLGGLTGTKQPLWVTGAAAKTRTYLLRAEADAILIGIGTALADDPELTCRLPGLESRSPIRVLLDSHLRLPLTARLVQTIRTTPLWIVCNPEAADTAQSHALAATGVRIVPELTTPEHTSALARILAWLAAEGITRVLAEPGPTLGSSLAATGLVDEYLIYRGARSIAAAEGVPLETIWPPGLFQGYAAMPGQEIGDDRIESFRRLA